MNITADQIILLEYQLIEAIKTSDITFLDKILHDDLLFMIPNGDIITKAMDLASHSSGDMKVQQLSPAIEHVNVMNDTAVVTVVYDTKGTMLGTPIEGKFRYIRVWKQFPDGLQVIGGSCCKLVS